MAERVAELPALRWETSPRYPWDEWFDGSVWKLTPGVDFDKKPFSMQCHAGQVARRRGGKLLTRTHDGALYIQFIPGEEGRPGQNPNRPQT